MFGINYDVNSGSFIYTLLANHFEDTGAIMLADTKWRPCKLSVKMEHRSDSSGRLAVHITICLNIHMFKWIMFLWTFSRYMACKFNCKCICKFWQVEIMHRSLFAAMNKEGKKPPDFQCKLIYAKWIWDMQRASKF